MNSVKFFNMIFQIVLFLILTLSFSVGYAEPSAEAEWQRALPGAKYVFPVDHMIHPAFKTEWWYFTGTVQAANGKEYGYELTFFRQGVLPPGLQAARLNSDAGNRSQFVQNDFKFAHFAISDLSGHEFRFTQKINRGTFGDAGFAHPFDPATDTPPASVGRNDLAWIDDWSLQPQADGSWKIRADAASPTQMSIDLDVMPTKLPVIEGVDGVSQKANGAGNASYYYSFTRLKTRGTLAVGSEKPQPVQGESWFDHEWASNQLAPDQVGWDWFCFQFEDQTEVMLYAMRRRDGTVDPVSSGTWVAADGRVEHLKFDDFTLRSARTWQSPQTGAVYPLTWQVSIPAHQLNFTVQSKLDTQELVLPPISYWEGAIQAEGHRGGHAIKGHGYMELTGYAGALKGLQEQPRTADDHLRPMAR